MFFHSSLGVRLAHAVLSPPPGTLLRRLRLLRRDTSSSGGRWATASGKELRKQFRKWLTAAERADSSTPYMTRTHFKHKSKQMSVYLLKTGEMRHVGRYQPGGMSWRYVLHIWWSVHWFLFSNVYIKKEILEWHKNTRKGSMWQWWLDSWIHTHIEVLQLGFGRSLIHKLQNRAQIANVDASLAQGLGQRGSVHGQSAVVQTVFNLIRKHTHIHTWL